MGMRSGTLPTHQIVELAAAANSCRRNCEETEIGKLRDRFVSHLQQIPGVHLQLYRYRYSGSQRGL